MKKILVLALSAIFLSGCATYKFQRGKPPYDKGYVVSRDGYVIPEYTLGRDNSVPKLELARERFRKRRRIVEHYYKKMGYAENHFKMVLWNPCIMFMKGAGGVFRFPFIAVSDYRYEHNPEYRKKMDKREQIQDAMEEARIQKLKEKLNIYLQKELEKEKQSKAN